MQNPLKKKKSLGDKETRIGKITEESSDISIKERCTRMEGETSTMEEIHDAQTQHQYL